MSARPARSALPGSTFGRWTVISIASHNMRKCICKCGNRKTVNAYTLVSSLSKSCGCLRREITIQRSTTHGASVGGKATRLYQCWASMIQRCTNPRASHYSYYGGRGITVSKEWIESFQTFAHDMGSMPEGSSIERINNDGQYCKENCEWATKAQQSRNRRSVTALTYNGITMCQIDWASMANINYRTLRSRLNSGWSVEQALSTPVRAHV